jgi:hypothetical protein
MGLLLDPALRLPSKESCRCQRYSLSSLPPREDHIITKLKPTE